MRDTEKEKKKRHRINNRTPQAVCESHLSEIHKEKDLCHFCRKDNKREAPGIQINNAE